MTNENGIWTSECVTGGKVKYQYESGRCAGEDTQAALNEVADRLTIARQRPGQCEKASAAGGDTGGYEQPQIDPRRAGKDGHHLYRRHVRETRGYQHQQDSIPARRRSKLLEGVELAVEGEDGLGDFLIGIVAEVIARNAAEGRSKGGRQRIPVGPRRFCECHRHKQDVGGNKENGAFDESDGSEPRLGCGGCCLL